jgi:hypothetical protein
VLLHKITNELTARLLQPKLDPSITHRNFSC